MINPCHSPQIVILSQKLFRPQRKADPDDAQKLVKIRSETETESLHILYAAGLSRGTQYDLPEGVCPLTL